MPNKFLETLGHWLGGTRCFLVYGKARRESEWRTISVYASHRRDVFSGVPFLSGACTTWGVDAIAVGWDFALGLLREQCAVPASRNTAVTVIGGRLRNRERRAAAGETRGRSYSEVMAHECGHTWQAKKMGPVVYLLLGGTVTLFREGPHPWNRFENEASEQGMFGGIVDHSVCPELMNRLAATR